MWKRANRFFRDECGAVTVDWVVLTAAVVGLAVIAYIGIEQQTMLLQADAANNIAGEIGN